ncbi:DUF6762 family protein [uncultured Clostridium sp.]|uniref:DUF6762 family protein n=1 Tax=uncultured Clostridium sp. TaxID=59620 RepID=UPI0028EE781B|nr:DUF6762 family protein [uncultured Clostridium sp.]
MEFSSLILMKKENNIFVKELGSYKVDEGAEYITQFFYDGENINLYFDTKNDVEEWEYTAIYDCFNEEIFKEKGYYMEYIDDEYNPTWLIKFEYIEDIEEIENKLSEICHLIKNEMDRVFEEIKLKKDEYV